MPVSKEQHVLGEIQLDAGKPAGDGVDPGALVDDGGAGMTRVDQWEILESKEPKFRPVSAGPLMERVVVLLSVLDLVSYSNEGGGGR